MKFDLMTGNLRWQDSAALAASVQSAGFSGMLFTETSQVPWMMIAAAATAAPKLEFSTGIAVAFARRSRGNSRAIPAAAFGLA